MNGREDKRENDLFFVCSLIEYIGRITHNARNTIVKKLGYVGIQRLLELADILHCEPIEKTANDLITRYEITKGNFDNTASCKYTVPMYFDIAKVYKRLIVSVACAKEISIANALMQVYSSWICGKIDDYNSSMFFENPQCVYESYVAGKAV